MHENQGRKRKIKKKKINAKSKGITPHVLSRKIDAAVTNQKTKEKFYFFGNKYERWTINYTA